MQAERQQGGLQAGNRALSEEEDHSPRNLDDNLHVGHFVLEKDKSRRPGT